MVLFSLYVFIINTIAPVNRAEKTLLQENKVPFNYACTCESVLLTGAIVLMIKTYRLNKTIQIHSAYASVITCVRSVRLRQIHNSEG